MKPEFDSGGAQFHTTLWTLVMISAQSQAEAAKAALAELCRIWFPFREETSTDGRSFAAFVTKSLL